MRTQTRPDTSTTTQAWDPYGRHTGTTRQDGVTVSFGHDTLGRRTSATAGGQAHGITYDTCVNGKGRVCRLTDPGQTLDLSYTPYGDLAGKVPTIAGSPVNLGHGFQYDAQGRLSKIVYPNGVEATYAYTLDRVTSLTVKINGQTKTVANAIQYDPMGPVKQLAFGNGGGRIHYYDTDYRLTDIVTDLKVGYHFDFDANDRITGYTNFANGDWSYGFGHDELHRLKSASSPGLGSQNFTYDKTGNRKTQNATVYTIASGSNRLMSEGGRSYAYTLTGNVKTITGFGIGTGDDLFHNGFQFEQAPVTTFTYDPFDRLTGVTGNGISASYKRGPDGARYQKTANGETTRFVYGPNGMLLSEHRQTPARWTHYLWLNGQPVALVRNNTLYWIQTDHLGRPEGITDQARQRMWRAATMPFGRTVIDDVIGGFHLGFPGQYHDAETGFAYNIHRTYMPAVGRYLETDPIGLAGGINTYAYAGSNPVSRIDPLGLKDYSRCETLDLLAQARADMQGSLPRRTFNALRNHAGFGRFDFRINSPTDTFFADGQRLSAAEFGNYIAGYSGIHYGGYTGFGLVMLGGVAYDIAERGVYTDLDESSRPAMEAGAMRAMMERDFNLGACGCSQ